MVFNALQLVNKCMLLVELLRSQLLKSTVSNEVQPEYLELVDYQLFAVNTVEKWIGSYLWVYGK